MFNGKGYSLSDIAAVSGGARNGDGFFGGGEGWWIILLFLLRWMGKWQWLWGGGGAGNASDALMDLIWMDLKMAFVV